MWLCFVLIMEISSPLSFADSVPFHYRGYRGSHFVADEEEEDYPEPDYSDSDDDDGCDVNEDRGIQISVNPIVDDEILQSQRKMIFQKRLQGLSGEEFNKLVAGAGMSYRSFLRIRPGRQYGKWGSANVKLGHKLPPGR